MKQKPNLKHANPCPPCPANATLTQKIIYWLGIGLGSGLPKRAAGTWGTLGGLLFGITIFLLFGNLIFFTFIIIGLLIGNYICGETSNLMGVHDDPHIVWDEWVGIWITLIPVFWQQSPSWQLLQSPHFWLKIVICFILFRIFDIVKPQPIGWVDKNAKGGFGIMIDDILAGFMAMGIFLILLKIL